MQVPYIGKRALEWLGYFPVSEHKAIDRLAAALFVNSSDPRGRLIVMFTAYFDASGSESSPFIVVSGYIASYVQWSLFEDNWKRVHKERGVDLPFHATELMAAMSNPAYKHQVNSRQDYVALASEPKRAAEFLEELSGIQILFLHCAITSIVPMDIYKGVSSLLDIRTTIPPYALAARQCIEFIAQWERFFKMDQGVEYIFERGDFGQGEFTKIMVDEGMRAPIYKDKCDFSGLQAADHYAWERSFFEKKVLGADIPPRRSGQILMEGIPKLHIKSTVTNLINVCHLKGIDPRTGVKHDK